MKPTTEGNRRQRREDYPNLYEFRRENLWMEVKEPDDEKSVKVVSFFKQKSRGDPEITGRVRIVPHTLYELVCNVDDVAYWLKKKYAVLRYWKPYERDIFASLQLYVDQCVIEGCSKCILSKQEFALLQPKRKKRGH